MNINNSAIITAYEYVITAPPSKIIHMKIFNAILPEPAVFFIVFRTQWRRGTEPSASGRPCAAGRMAWLLSSPAAEAAHREASCLGLMSFSEWRKLSDRLWPATPRVKSSQVCLRWPASHRVSPEVWKCSLTQHCQDLPEEGGKNNCGCFNGEYSE